MLYEPFAVLNPSLETIFCYVGFNNTKHNIVNDIKQSRPAYIVEHNMGIAENLEMSSHVPNVLHVRNRQ